MKYLKRTHNEVHESQTATGWELFGRRAIRQGEWKAVFIPKPHGPGRWQLYDLAKDRGETDDLAARHPVMLATLLRLWDSYVEETGVISGPASIFELDVVEDQL